MSLWAAEDWKEVSYVTTEPAWRLITQVLFLQPNLLLFPYNVCICGIYTVFIGTSLKHDMLKKSN